MITMNIVTIRDDEPDEGIKNLRDNASDGSEVQANHLQSHFPPPELNYTYLSNKSHSWRADDSCSPSCLLFKFHGIFHAYSGGRPPYLGMKFGPCLCSIGNSVSQWSTLSP